jgi:Bacterial Ig domain/Multicopper oxidase
MHTKYFKLGTATTLALAAVLLAPNQARAAEFYLKAAATTVDMPNPLGGAPITVPMWGYASCSAGFGATCGPVVVPGPALTVPANDPVLTVHLLNNLSQPTSLVINGLLKSMTPVWDSGATGPRPNLTARVRSFDVEAAAGATADYTWSNVKPGTYLYQSGTQAQVQVQMGLYGAARKSAVDAVSGTTRGQAYAGTSYEYDNQATLLYSEIDTALHSAVAGGTYGTTGPTSTLNYAPTYFLINGQPYPMGTPVITPSGDAGTTLLRMLNAGLITHVPMIHGTHWTLIAEDGKPYAYGSGTPHLRSQYTALLPAAKTADALLTPNSGGARYAILDRRLGLSNAGASDGGMLAFLQFGAAGTTGASGTVGNLAPVTTNDAYNSVVGVTLNVGAAEGVLINDSDPDGLPLPLKAVAATGTTALGGNYTLNTNGSFSYTPAAATSGADSFSYQITDGKALAATPGTVTITLTTPTAPALATLDDFDRANANSLGSNWSQIASTGSFPDVQINGNLATAATTALGGLALWNTSYGATQGAGFSSATPLANAALVLKASGGSAAAPANYVRVRCELGNGGEVVVATMMGGSNVSVFVKQAAFSAPSCSGNGALSAVVDAKGLVTIFLGGNYVGGVQLPDVGAWKGAGRMGIQLQNQGASVDNFSGGTLP